jgi:hypothetical protein
MPHQMAIQSGVIRPRYPAAPQQWSSAFDQRPTAPAPPPIPRVSAGVQRNYSSQWPGEHRFGRIEQLGNLMATAALGYAYVTKTDDEGEGDDKKGYELPSPEELENKTKITSDSGPSPEFKARPMEDWEVDDGDTSELGSIARGFRRVKEVSPTEHGGMTGTPRWAREGHPVFKHATQSDVAGPTRPTGASRGTTTGIGAFGQDLIGRSLRGTGDAPSAPQDSEDKPARQGGLGQVGRSRFRANIENVKGLI